MNLTKRYRKDKKITYILLQNMDEERRMLVGTILEQGEYLIMDMGTAMPYLSMAPDQSWMGIWYINTPKEYKPKAIITQPVYGQGAQALADELEEERIVLNLQPRWPIHPAPADTYRYQETPRRQA